MYAASRIKLFPNWERNVNCSLCAEHFHPFSRWKFHIITDHKPLLGIFKSNKLAYVNPRIDRWPLEIDTLRLRAVLLSWRKWRKSSRFYQSTSKLVRDRNYKSSRRILRIYQRSNKSHDNSGSRNWKSERFNDASSDKSNRDWGLVNSGRSKLQKDQGGISSS